MLSAGHVVFNHHEVNISKLFGLSLFSLLHFCPFSYSTQHKRRFRGTLSLRRTEICLFHFI